MVGLRKAEIRRLQSVPDRAAGTQSINNANNAAACASRAESGQLSDPSSS